jgi:hypothetical protein
LTQPAKGVKLDYMKFRIENWKAILPLVCLLCVPIVNLHASTLAATATFTDTEVSPGLFEYDLTLNNTGTTDVGTFWFSWIPGANFMTMPPTAIQSPAGWTGVDISFSGTDSIQWVDSGSLSAGTSQSGFEFDSTLTPAQMAGPSSMPGFPVATSFVYIGAPLVGPGLQFVATPAPASTPEPGTIILTALGIGLAGFGRKLFRRA